MVNFEHANSCPMEDPESYAPCNCGASKKTKDVDRIDDDLKVIWRVVKDMHDYDDSQAVWEAAQRLAKVAKDKILGL